MLRGIFLALIGPVIGTCVIVLLIPLLVLGFFMGWRIWIFILAIVITPSVTVPATTLVLQVRKNWTYKNIIATTMAGEIYPILGTRSTTMRRKAKGHTYLCPSAGPFQNLFFALWIIALSTIDSATVQI
jgi:hypothetical protein